MQQDLRALWFPVASSGDLPFRHVYQGQLLGLEFAVWRADDGAVNVWENRCLHRGVRLSIGLNLGSELKCQYHGWRYANGDASCLYIPAHPANAPARTIRNRVYRSVERYGLIWSAIEPLAEPPVIPELETAEPLALRPMPVAAPASRVVEALRSYAARLGAEAVEPATDLRPDGAFALRASWRRDSEVETAAFFVQPTAARACVIRGLLLGDVAEAERVATLKAHNAALTALREEAEAADAREPDAAAAVEEAEIPLSPRVTTVAGGERAASGEAIRVRVARKWRVAADVVALRLEPVSGALPPPAPGAHVDLHLPNGLVRQYSLTNGPAERDAYVVAVKREPQSLGGSAAVHDAVREGDLLAVSPPHDNFRLARGGGRHVLLAGGIGVTPLLAMAKALAASGRPFELHLFARSAEHAPFADDLGGLGASVQMHIALDPASTGDRIASILANRADDAHVYVCGPAPMIEAAVARAEQAGWPDSAVHFEHFGNAKAVDDSTSFEVALARSAITVAIPAGRTITDVLREHGVSVPTSCEQGACGTCITTVLEGKPDHQDVFLSKAERASDTCMTPCTSRSLTPRLVLDL
ncbi:Rieske 2Fe-2S domain-containing protein [Methylopila henanensis]|uniref:Rieske 2Fe-2S domain-containing protein n=1 Tax=Methylopila henanensis TaxID=873516 RepID=A0ABW4K8S8_9HYPH